MVGCWDCCAFYFETQIWTICQVYMYNMRQPQPTITTGMLVAEASDRQRVRPRVGGVFFPTHLFGSKGFSPVSPLFFRFFVKVLE